MSEFDKLAEQVLSESQEFLSDIEWLSDAVHDGALDAIVNDKLEDKWLGGEVRFISADDATSKQGFDAIGIVYKMTDDTGEALPEQSRMMAEFEDSGTLRGVQPVPSRHVPKASQVAIARAIESSIQWRGSEDQEVAVQDNPANPEDGETVLQGPGQHGTY